MVGPRNIEIGQVYWVEGVPPLDGSGPARRPVVVIDLADDDPVIVVGVTTDRSDPGRVDLPSSVDEPGATSGLSQRCCAIPRWIIALDRERLRRDDYAGYVPQVVLAALADAVEAILSEWPRSDQAPGPG